LLTGRAIIVEFVFVPATSRGRQFVFVDLSTADVVYFISRLRNK